MRLIDADALIPTQVHTVVVLKDGREQLESVLYAEQVDDAPTVEPASPWHRVEEELPKYGQDVLAARLYGADSDGWAYEVIIAHVCEVRGTNYWNATNVTHWMPLPEPPKEDADADK